MMPSTIKSSQINTVPSVISHRFSNLWPRGWWKVTEALGNLGDSGGKQVKNAFCVPDVFAEE